MNDNTVDPALIDFALRWHHYDNDAGDEEIYPTFGISPGEYRRRLWYALNLPNAPAIDEDTRTVARGAHRRHRHRRTVKVLLLHEHRHRGRGHEGEIVADAPLPVFVEVETAPFIDVAEYDSVQQTDFPAGLSIPS